MPNSERARAAFQAALLQDDPAELYDQAPCGYLSTSPNGSIVKVNKTFLTWTGYTCEDLVGHQFTDLLTTGGRIYHETHYAPMLLMQDSAREIALELVRADGSTLPVLLNAALQRGPDGAPLVTRIAVFDATERRAYEQELLEAKHRAEVSEARATALARTLQETLIPPEPPQVPGLDIAAEYRPAGNGEEVGGDFYDIFQIAADDWVAVLGDVSGKGTEAAVLTALVRYTVRDVAVRMEAPSQALRELNRTLLAHGGDRFCTITLLRLRHDAGQWTITMSSGGHPLPLLLSPAGPPHPVGLPGSLVGVLEVADYEDSSLTLAPGETLVLYTDGVTEGRRGRNFYGEARLLQACGRPASSAGELAAGLLGDVLEFQGNLPRDDIALLVIRADRPQIPPGFSASTA